MLHSSLMKKTNAVLFMQALLCLFLLLALHLPGSARENRPASLAEIQWQDLPSQARTTYRLILAGGPFPYEKDGTVFGNRERLLPAQRRGYYREYTVKTPWVRHRGARRIVCGGTQPSAPESCYYTADHYSSFKRIVAPER